MTIEQFIAKLRTHLKLRLDPWAEGLDTMLANIQEEIENEGKEPDPPDTGD